MEKLQELLVRIQKIKPERAYNAIQLDIDIHGFELQSEIIYRISLTDFQYRSEWGNLYEIIHEVNIFLDGYED